MYVHHTSKKYLKKLTPEQWSYEYKNYAANCEDLDLKTIKNMLTNGYGMVFAHCSDNCTLDCWIDQQLFAIDMDNDKNTKLDKKDALARSEKIGLPCIVYNSFSNSKKKQKYRMIFQTSEAITDIDLAKEIAGRLYAMFPEADKQSVNIIQNYNGTTSRRVEFNPESYLDIEALRTETPDYGQVDTTTSKRIAAQNSYVINMDTLTSYCGLAYDFKNATRELHWAELMLLGSFATNIRGGIAWFQNCLADGKNSFEYTKIVNNISAYSKKGYHMQNCESTCPYFDQCQNFGKNIYDKVAKDKMAYRIRKLHDPDEHLTVPELETDTYNILKTYRESDAHVSILKAPTATGKTEAYINIAKAGDIISIPTHLLANEIKTRLEAIGKPAVVIRERPDLLQKDKPSISQLMVIGAYSAASAIYRAKVEDYKKLHEKTEQMQICIDWLQTMDSITDDTIVICTHSRQKYYDSNRAATVWVDEDPLQSAMIRKEYIKTQDIDKLLRILKKSVSSNENISAFTGKESEDKQIEIVAQKALAYITSINKTYNAMTPASRRDYVFNGNFTSEELKRLRKIVMATKNNYSSEIFSLFAAGEIKIVIDTNANQLAIVAFDESFIKPNRKYIIMSATINEHVWKHLVLKDAPVTWKELKAQDYGDIRQFHKMKTSRNGIDANLCQYIINTVQDINLPVITFKGQKQQKVLSDYGFNVSTEMHLGNTAGKDGFKGQDIIVIGTYYMNMQLYFETAAALGIVAEGALHWRKVKYNGFEFPLMTFSRDKQELAEIQLYIMDTELTQAVGRARALRTDATVFVFSDFPVPGARICD